MNANEQERPLSKEQAQAALQQIDEVIALTRKAIAHGSAAPLLIFWGAIWVIGYSVSEFAPTMAPKAWAGLGLGGGLISWFLGWYFRSPVKSPNDAKIGLFWLVLFAYAAIWMGLLAFPASPQETVALVNKFGAYWATIPMFAYVVAGLWLGRFFAWLGAAVTVLTLLGYFCLPAHFSLWMAVTGGGALIVSGGFIRRFWR